MTGAVFVTCPDWNRLMLGDRRGSVVTAQPHACAGRCDMGHRLRPGNESWAHVSRLDASEHYREEER